MATTSTNSIWAFLSQRVLACTVSSQALSSDEDRAVLGQVFHQVSADVWYREWTLEGERFFARGSTCEDRGDLADARQAYVHACICYRTSYLPFFGEPADPWLIDAFQREADAFNRVARCSTPFTEVTWARVDNATLLLCFARLHADRYSA